MAPAPPRGRSSRRGPSRTSSSITRSERSWSVARSPDGAKRNPGTRPRISRPRRRVPRRGRRPCQDSAPSVVFSRSSSPPPVRNGSEDGGHLVVGIAVEARPAVIADGEPEHGVRSAEVLRNEIYRQFELLAVEKLSHRTPVDPIFTKGSVVQVQRLRLRLQRDETRPHQPDDRALHLNLVPVRGARYPL